jgi:hypothetical protein
MTATGTTSPTLRVSYNKVTRELLLEGLKSERFEHHGFGTFLLNIDPKEITITRNALQALLDCPYRQGLEGMEIWGANRIAWGDPKLTMTVPVDEICCEPEAKKWLRECNIE